jgi:PPOX class probable F420-dependent enzyme
MSDEEREEFLREANVAVLGTVNRRGQPHGAPVWYLYDDGVFVVSTGRESRKHRNVVGNPNVSLVVDTKKAPYYAVMIQGTAEVGPPLGEGDRLELATRYLGPEVGRRYFESTRAGHEETVTLRITPKSAAVFDSGLGRRARQ